MDKVLLAFQEYKQKNEFNDQLQYMGAMSMDTSDNVSFYDQVGTHILGPQHKLLDGLSQVRIMLRRHAYLTYKDPVPYIGRGILFLFTNFYFAIGACITDISAKL